MLYHAKRWCFVPSAHMLQRQGRPGKGRHLVPYSFTDLTSHASISLQMTWSSLNPSLSINHGNSVWRITTAWYLEGKCIKQVSWAWHQFWVCYSSCHQWFWSLSGSSVLHPLHGGWEIRPSGHFDTWQHCLCRRRKEMHCFCEHTNDAKAGEQKENEAIHISLRELNQKSNFLVFNVWEVEIKSRLSINEFMVSETPLSPRKI